MVLADQETVTLRFETEAVGAFPAGIVTAFADWLPVPTCVQAAVAAAAGATAAIAVAMMIGRRVRPIESSL
jgi:hypothetical protein